MEQYALALRRHRQVLAQLQSVQAELEAACADWQSLMMDGCPAERIVHAQGYFQTVEARRREALGAVRDAEQQVQASLQAMLAARRDREAVDAFAGHQRVAYDRALQAEERKVLDELAQRRGASPMSWSSQQPVSHG